MGEKRNKLRHLFPEITSFEFFLKLLADERVIVNNEDLARPAADREALGDRHIVLLEKTDKIFDLDAAVIAGCAVGLELSVMDPLQHGP